LAILESDSAIGIVESEHPGDGIPEGFESSNGIVVVQNSMAAGDEATADNHASFAARLWLRFLVQCWTRILFSLSGRHGTHRRIQVRVTAFEAFTWVVGQLHGLSGS